MCRPFYLAYCRCFLSPFQAICLAEYFLVFIMMSGVLGAFARNEGVYKTVHDRVSTKRDNVTRHQNENRC